MPRSLQVLSGAIGGAPRLRFCAKKFQVGFHGNEFHFYRVCNQALPVRQTGALRLAVRATASGSSRTSTWDSRRGRQFSAQDNAERQKKFNELIQEITQLAVQTGPRGGVRLVQGVQALTSVTSEWLIDFLQESQRRSPGQPLQVTPPGPRQLRQLFEQLGTTYIKLGQFIASAPSLFPAEYVEEFQKCLDRAPPVPFDQIKSTITQDLGRPINEVYEFVDPTPLASASVAQVHSARLKGSGRAVVIKVLKPGVEDILTADLNFLYVAARVLEFLNPEISRTSLVGIVGDIRSSMLEETDFRKEAAHIQSFRSYLQAMGLTNQAAAPEVFLHCSSGRVLTMERFFGVPLTDLESLRGRVESPEATLITALNVWFGSLVSCETFHADVHAGNLLVLEDGRVGFIDFGIVGRISPSTWAAVQTFLGSVGSGEYRAMAAALTQMGATDSVVDQESFARDLEKLFESLQELDPEVLVTASRAPQGASVSASVSLDEQQVNRLLLDVFRVSEGYGLRFPREFGLLLKQLLYFDRYTRLLAPSLNVLQDERVLIGREGFKQG